MVRVGIGGGGEEVEEWGEVIAAVLEGEDVAGALVGNEWGGGGGGGLGVGGGWKWWSVAGGGGGGGEVVGAG